MYLGLIVFTYAHKVPGSNEGGRREKRGEAERVCGYMHFRFETPRLPQPLLSQQPLVSLERGPVTIKSRKKGLSPKG